MNTKENMISAGVRNLKEFGYPQCDKENILTDDIFKAFFASMLKDNKGHGADTDKAIDELLSVVESNAKVSRAHD